MWLMEVAFPPQMRLYDYHHMIWGFFPDLKGTGNRPFLFRTRSGRALVLSRVRPAARNAIEIDRENIRAGECYQFAIDCIPWARDKYGKKRIVQSVGDRMAWIRRRVSGAEVTHSHHIHRPKIVRIKKPDGNIIIYGVDSVQGVLYITDRARFIDCLLHGIGAGKAFGMGMLYLPEVMQWSH